MILYQNKYITPHIYIREVLNRSPQSARLTEKAAKQRGMTLYSYLESTGQLPSQIEERAKNHTFNLSDIMNQTARYSLALGPRTKIQTMDEAASQTLKPLFFSESHFITS